MPVGEGIPSSRAATNRSHPKVLCDSRRKELPAPSFTTPTWSGYASEVVPPTPLESFRHNQTLSFFGTDDLAAPAGDGVSNLLKFACNMLGTSTGQAADVDTPNAATLVPDGVAGLPLAEADEATGKLIFTYIRRKNSTDPGVTYSVEFSDDLGSWAENLSATASATALTGADSDFERVEITDTTASPARRFARLKVVVTP